MMEILANTKIYKNFQTAIPKEIRKKFNVDKNTIIEWGINEKGEVKINFRKKVNLEDIIDIVKTDEVTNSVELKKEAYLNG